MTACERCWRDAYMRSLGDTTKTMTQHYMDLLDERKDNPCEPEASTEVEPGPARTKEENQ
jgi:hypothetical protein